MNILDLSKSKFQKTVLFGFAERVALHKLVKPIRNNLKRIKTPEYLKIFEYLTKLNCIFTFTKKSWSLKKKLGF
jgi:hypothetical protein